MILFLLMLKAGQISQVANIGATKGITIRKTKGKNKY
jgi:hypothetical protein